MTLREKIEQAADKYTDNADTFIEYSDDGGWSDKNDIEYVEKAYKVGAEYGYNLAVEKVVEWLKKDLIETKDRDGYPSVESRSCRTVDEFINELKQAIK